MSDSKIKAHKAHVEVCERCVIEARSRLAEASAFRDEAVRQLGAAVLAEMRAPPVQVPPPDPDVCSWGAWREDIRRRCERSDPVVE